MFEDLKLDLKLKWLRSLLGKKVGLGYHDNVLHYNDIVSISSTYSDIPIVIRRVDPSHAMLHE